MKSEVEIYEAIARGWCHDTNSSKEMDSLLGEAIAIEVLEVVRPLVAERDALADRMAAWIDRCCQQQERADKAEEARDEWRRKSELMAQLALDEEQAKDQALAERDEAQLARDLFQRQEADAIRYWQQALAEGRLLREALLEWKFVTQSMAGPDLIDAMEQGYEALNATPIVAAEVERVRRLEDEVELRECKDNWLREALLNKHEIRFVDATPDDGLPFRILRAYIDHTSWADNTLGIEPSSPLCAELNQLQASRNRIIERALAELEEGEG